MVFRSHTWRGCTVCHVEFVHGDLEGEKVAGASVRRNTVAQVAQTLCSDCRGHDFNRPRQLPHGNSHNSLTDLTLLKSQRRRTMEGQMGGSPKASSTASGRGNQPAGETRNMMVRHEKLYHYLDESGYDVCGCRSRGEKR